MAETQYPCRAKPTRTHNFPCPCPAEACMQCGVELEPDEGQARISHGVTRIVLCFTCGLKLLKDIAK